MRENYNSKMTRKTLAQKVGSILIIVILVTSGLFIIMPLNSIFSVAIDAPSSTERTDNDFYNGTLDNVTIMGYGTKTELILNGIESNQWTELNLSIYPKARESHELATIWGTDKVLLFGGGSGGSLTYNDTWVFDISKSIWTEMNPVNYPSERYFHAMASIWGTDKVLLTGGAKGPTNPRYNDTWIYDLSNNSWTNINTIGYPGYIWQHEMVTVYGDDKIVLFGGDKTSAGKNETWVFDLSQNTWTHMFPTIVPPWRTMHSMATIYYTDKILAFGGWAGTTDRNDTWIYDVSDNNWTQMAFGPEGRMQFDMATSYYTDKVVLFGGFKNAGPTLNDTWVFDFSENSWTKIYPDIAPSKRGSHAMAMIWGMDKVILFSGPAIGFPNDTWIFDLYDFVDNGTFISSHYNIGLNSTYKTISVNVTVTSNTNIEFQLRSAETELELYSKSFLGPDGLNTSFYPTTSSDIWPGHNGDQWIQYKAYFYTINKNETPRLMNVSIIYNYWPNTTLVNPINGSITGNDDPILIWNFTDRDSKNQIAFQIIVDDDDEFGSIDYDSGEINSTKNSTRFSNVMDESFLSDGIWYWKARTKDNDGDWGWYCPAWEILVDTNAPESNIILPEDNATYNELNVIIGNVNNSINGSPTMKVEISIKNLGNNLYWDGFDWRYFSPIWFLSSGKTNWSYNSSLISWKSGEKYKIQSRTTDNAGNIEVPKNGNVFTYDAGEVYFTNAFPNDSEFSIIEEVLVGITISDTVSGVNASSIQYTISEDNGKIWSSWIVIDGLNNQRDIYVVLNLTFPNGTDNRIKWRASDLAGNGPTESESYQININTWIPTNSTIIPKVRLWSPPNGSTIQTNSVNLSWFPIINDKTSCEYDVYFDDVNPPKEIISSGQLETFNNYIDLENGLTYYWTVIPKLNGINGTCISGVWSFKVDIQLPWVTLISPENGSTIQSPSPTLLWSVDYSGSEIITFDIYFGTENKLILEYEKYSETNYIPSFILEGGQTYYWKVVPWAENYKGSESEIWSFTYESIITINKSKFDLDLYISPPKIKLYPGNYTTVKVNVRNLGDITDNISINITNPNGENVIYRIMNSSTTQLAPMKSHEFDIFIQLPKDAIPGIILVNIDATSSNSIDQGSIVKKNATLVIMVSKIDQAKVTDSTTENIWISYLFLIIIIIIMICIIIIIMKHRKKEEEKAPEDAVTVKPSGEPVAVITIEHEGQLPETPSQEQLPETSETGEPQLQGITSPIVMPQLPPVDNNSKENINKDTSINDEIDQKHTEMGENT